MHQSFPSIIDIPANSGGNVQRDRWTGLIPAAGKGTRLGSKKPKALYPVLGRPMIDWILVALFPVCSRFVVIAAPDARTAIEDHLEKRFSGMYTLVEQERPTGMGDAILLGEPASPSPYVAVAWVDQVTLSERTVRACAALHENRSSAVLTLPTVVKERPYVHIERHPDGTISRIIQSREAGIDSPMGENDCGLFMFSKNRLFETLHRAKAQGRGIGETTREFDLVKLLPLFEQGPNSVLSVRLTDASESLGINTPEDAARIAEILSNRNSSAI